MKKILIGIAVLLLLGTGVYVAARPSGATDMTAQSTPTTSVVAEDMLVAEAKVVPVQSAALGLPNGGRVAEVLVRRATWFRLASRSCGSIAGGRKRMSPKPRRS